MNLEKYFPTSIAITDAADLQSQLAEQLELDDSISADPKTVGGIAIYSRGSNVSVGLVILDIEKKQVQKKEVINRKVSFPALPGCEGFREGRVVAEAITSFDRPDVFIINGHGINHPRRLGIASHVGLALDMPTIGASMQLMCGKVVEEDDGRYIYNNEERVGKIVKKELGSPSVFVSPGNKVSIETAARMIERVLITKIPEPVRIAQEALVGELQKQAGRI